MASDADVDAMRRALKRLVQRCDRLTEGHSRDEFVRAAKANPGSGSLRFVSHALMRDIIDAANASRAALARHDTAGQEIAKEASE